jgi:Relaxase/Mobilisation nuclease domain
VVIKGTSCAGARRLAVHLTRTDTNERAEVKELRGVVAEDLRGALLEMEAVAAGARTTKPFYHGSINTRADEPLTPEQRLKAIDRLEEALGLSGQPRVVVVHEKEGREHCHIVWSRIDLERMAAISDSHNYRKHEQIARDLEREFGHERVQGAHVERDGRPRPERTPSHAEMLQAERTGLSPNEAKEKITELWRSTDSGRAFAQALDQNGWVLARGDRRDFVVIDPKGGTHSLARRVEGAKAKDIRERMTDLDIERLPSVAEAKTIQRHRQAGDGERTQETPHANFQDAREQQRSDDEKKPKRSASADMEWTDRAGMVEQERSAMEWVKKSHDEKTVRGEKIDRRQEKKDAEQALTQRREALLRKLGRDIDGDPDNERDPARERGRSR